MPAPVNKDNIVSGAGRLYQCEEESVASIASATNDIVLSAVPDSTPQAGDYIFLDGIDKYADVGIYTVSAWGAGTKTITINESIANNQATTGGKVLFMSRGGTSLGGTDDGTEISSNKDFHDSEAAEAPVTLKKTLTKYTGNVNFALKETTLDNLLLAIGHGEVDSGTYTVAVPSDGAVTEIGIRLEAPGPSGVTTRKYMIPRLVSVGDSAHRYTKAGDTMFAVDGEMLSIWDDSNKEWVFFKVKDE